jgi:uncharacterized protein YndB with AHSA1/START domain
MWFSTQPADLSFTSRFEFVNVVDVAAPAERVFPLLTGERFAEWLPDLKGWDWTSPAPHGVGSTREVRLAMLSVKERILAWDEGRRFAFTIEAITIPLVRRMTEDMRLEPRGADACTFHYVVRYEPSRIMRVIHPIARQIFGEMFRSAAQNLARIARSA